MNIPSPSFIEYQPVESLIVLDLIIWEGLGWVWLTWYILILQGIRVP